MEENDDSKLRQMTILVIRDRLGELSEEEGRLLSAWLADKDNFRRCEEFLNVLLDLSPQNDQSADSSTEIVLNHPSPIAGRKKVISLWVYFILACLTAIAVAFFLLRKDSQQSEKGKRNTAPANGRAAFIDGGKVNQLTIDHSSVVYAGGTCFVQQGK
jgi:hypothetical protein